MNKVIHTVKLSNAEVFQATTAAECAKALFDRGLLNTAVTDRTKVSMSAKSVMDRLKVIGADIDIPFETGASKGNGTGSNGGTRTAKPKDFASAFKNALSSATRNYLASEQETLEKAEKELKDELSARQSELTTKYVNDTLADNADIIAIQSEFKANTASIQKEYSEKIAKLRPENKDYNTIIKELLINLVNGFDFNTEVETINKAKAESEKTEETQEPTEQEQEEKTE